jgi:signal peptidase II
VKPAQRTIVVVAVATLAVDLASKAWAAASLDEPIEIGASLSLQLAYNPGVAFGAGQSLPTWLLLALTGAICAGIAVAGWRGVLVPAWCSGVLWATCSTA